MSKQMWLTGFGLDDCFTISKDIATMPAEETISNTSVFSAESEVLEAKAPCSEDIEICAGFDDVVMPHQEDDANTVSAPATIEVSPIKVHQADPKKGWPTLTPEVHEGLKGTVTKFNANLAAINLLRELEKSGSPELTAAQRETLNQFTGWGGIKDPFDEGYLLKEEWRPRQAALKAVLSQEEWDTAKGSTLNAHFTPVSLIGVIWQALQRAGFKGGRFLETSAGVGYMLGTMPEHLVLNSEITAVELETVNASILQKLYGHEAQVINKGFEAVTLPENYYDLVFTNVPFGQYQVACQRRKPYSNWSIHNYFVARAIDLLRPGGLAVIITSSHFMDGHQTHVRNYINRKAEMLQAVRLPTGAFSQIADTDVVADILVLRKRDPAKVVSSQDGGEWQSTAPAQTGEGERLSIHKSTSINDYWNQNPSHVMGTPTLRHLKHGERVVPVLNSMDELPQRLEKCLSALPSDAYVAPVEVKRSIVVNNTRQDLSLEPGSFVLNDAGGISRVVGYGSQEDAKLPKSRIHRVVGMIGLRDCALDLVRKQSDIKARDEDLASLRERLNRVYDAFVAKFGPIHDKQNRWSMASDPYWPLLLSLETVNAEHGVQKAHIFTERTVYPSEMPISAQTPSEAALICVSELGRLDPNYLGRLMGTDGNIVLSALLESSEAFIDPVTHEVEMAHRYLSGNVREKLSIAQVAGEKFHRNVQALLGALPADLKPTQIDVLPGATWISTKDYEAFVNELSGAKPGGWDNASVTFDATTGSWTAQTYETPDLRTNWRGGGVEFIRLFEALLNQKDITVTYEYEGRTFTDGPKTAEARVKQDEIKLKFTEWIWADDLRATRLCKHYNETFNCWAAPKFDGSRLRLPGYSHALKLRPHQLNAVARGASGDNVLLGHDVGAGKSLEMICISMELRRLGIAKKPMHVVPGQCLEDYCAEFMRAYPGAQLLMATEKDFQKENRQAFVLRCATGNWDAVVISHKMFESISADPEITESYIKDILSELEATGLSNSSNRGQSRDVNRQKKDWQARLEKMQAAWKKDKLITFGQTGVDYLAIDEADVYKNLFRVSNMKSVAGLSASNSQRAFDVFLKCMQIQKLHGNRERGICMATATFISNTIAEAHTFQRYLQPFTLKGLNLDKFDAWAALFGRAVNSLEVSPDGSSFRMHKRFKQFVNIPELMGMFRQMADIQTKEMLDLPRPQLQSGGHQISVGEADDLTKEFVKKLVARAEALRNKSVKADQDNMLAITGDGRKCALDMRMVMPDAPFNPNGKIGRCVDKVFDIWEKTTYRKGAQIIFSDMGTPSGKTFNVYEDIRERLVSKGIPRTEIAFIHEAKTARAKSHLFALVRAGVVRVILGSTGLCGVGANMQTRLYAAHHLDCPWRPRDITQRDGRIERQGNTWEAVEIWRYVTAGTFDAYSWQTISAKAQFIAQIMRGDAEVRTVEDAQMAALSYEEVKALACGNPLVQEKAKIDAELLMLGLKEKTHREAVWSAKASLRTLDGDIQRMLMAYESRMAFVRHVDYHSTPERSGLVVDGKLYRDRAQIEKILTLSVAALRQSQNYAKTKLGDYNGITLMFHGLPGGQFNISAVSSTDASNHGVIGQYSRGDTILVKTLEWASQLADRAHQAKHQAEYLESSRSTLTAKANEVFPHHAQLEALRSRSQQIGIELGLLKAEEGTDSMDTSVDVKSELAKALADSGCVEEEDSNVFDEEASESE